MFIWIIITCCRAADFAARIGRGPADDLTVALGRQGIVSKHRNSLQQSLYALSSYALMYVALISLSVGFQKLVSQIVFQTLRL